jgi:hypothetical protein
MPTLPTEFTPYSSKTLEVYNNHRHLLPKEAHSPYRDMDTPFVFPDQPGGISYMDFVGATNAALHSDFGNMANRIRRLSVRSETSSIDTNHFVPVQYTNWDVVMPGVAQSQTRGNHLTIPGKHETERVIRLTSVTYPTYGEIAQLAIVVLQPGNYYDNPYVNFETYQSKRGGIVQGGMFSITNAMHAETEQLVEPVWDIKTNHFQGGTIHTSRRWSEQYGQRPDRPYKFHQLQPLLSSSSLTREGTNFTPAYQEQGFGAGWKNDGLIFGRGGDYGFAKQVEALLKLTDALLTVQEIATGYRPSEPSSTRLQSVALIGERRNLNRLLESE